jgi:trans-2,3-dihydro-3-hydroxyanthranilate isomerase
MTQSTPEFGAPIDERGAVAAALGVRAADLAGSPIQQVSCGVPYLLVPLRDRESVDRAVPDAAASRRLAEEIGVALPIFLFAIVGDGAIYSRMFAPTFGIAEDPATGSAAGPVGCYVVRHGLVSAAAAAAIVSDQGIAMGRASRIHIAIAGTADAITQVRVGGEAVLVGRGELLV